MIDKIKNDNNPRIGMIPFLALWSAAQLGGWMATLYLWLNYFPVLADPAPHSILVALLPGLIPALLQMLLIRYGLKKQSVRQLVPVTVVGYVASAIAYFAYLQMPFSYDATAPRVVSLFLPVALIQAAWLSRRVKNAWLWAVAGVVSAVLFALPLNASTAGSETQEYIMVGLAAIMQGIVTGSVMRHLWTQDRRKDKAMALERATEEKDQERALRLSDFVRQDEIKENPLADMTRNTRKTT